MGAHFKHFSFPDNRSTFHYVNPCHNGIFRIPGETQVGLDIIMDATWEPDARGFMLSFDEEEKQTKNLFCYDVRLTTFDCMMISSFAKTIHQCKFNSKSQFVLHIKTSSKCFEIKINDHKPDTFEVREDAAFTKAHYVIVTGNIEIRSFHIQKNVIERTLQGNYSPVTMPYISVPGNGKIGDIFTIHGKVSPLDDTAIFIKFVDVPKDGDTQLYFAPRWSYCGGTTDIVRNFRLKNTCGITDNASNPIALGADFKADILIEKEHYRIWIDEVEIPVHKHGIPFRGIAYVKFCTSRHLTNDCFIKTIVMSRVNCRTPLEFGYRRTFDIENVQADCVTYFPKIPVNFELAHDLDTGNCIYISGVFKKAKKFQCDLNCLEGRPVLEMRVDFNSKTVTFPSGQSPTVKTFPFHEDGYFQMQIFCSDQDTLVVSVGDVSLGVFKTSVKYTNATHVYVSGDVRISVLAIMRE